MTYWYDDEEMYAAEFRAARDERPGVVSRVAAWFKRLFNGCSKLMGRGN